MNTLPFTNFEELMFWEDRPGYPFSVLLRLRFTGRLDRVALHKALSQAVARHPLLMSKVECRGRCWHWVLAEPEPAIDWKDVLVAPSDDFPRVASIDLRNEIGVRAFVTAGSQISDVIVQFHHSCCDGAGLFSFFNDFLILYARERGETSRQVSLPDYDIRRLPGRGRFGLTWRKLLKMLPRQLIGLQGAKQFMLRKTAPLLPHTARPSDDALPTDYPLFMRQVFTVDETIQRRQAAHRRNVSLNELLTRDLFLALIRWRREQGCVNDQDWLRMMVPMNLRSPDDRELPAANVVSLVFLDRRGVDAADPERLLASIHDELGLIKRNQLGLTFVFSLRLFQWLPGGLRKRARADKCTMSTVFTNIGKLFAESPLPTRDGELVVGDVHLHSFQVLVPLRPYTCVTFAAHEYAGRLGLDMHCDSAVVTTVQAQRVMELFIEQSRASAAGD